MKDLMKGVQQGVKNQEAAEQRRQAEQIQAEQIQEEQIQEEQQKAERQQTSSSTQPAQQTNPLNPYKNNITGYDPLSVQKKLTKNYLNEIWNKEIKGNGVSNTTQLLENYLIRQGYNLKNKNTKKTLNDFVKNKSSKAYLKQQKNKLLERPPLNGLVKNHPISQNTQEKKKVSGTTNQVEMMPLPKQ
jgi:signal recognition particle GTPase